MSPATFDRTISVVLPAYNEELCIEEAVRRCLSYLPSAFRAYEVIVVDDGSVDRTAEIVRGLEGEDPAVRLVRHPRNRGYGRAIASGFEASQNELIFFTDADNQFDVRELSDLVPLLEHADAVLGFRVYRYDTVLRCLLSWIYNRLVRVLFLVRVRDVDCSFKLFTRDVIDRLKLESDDFFIDTEIVARLGKMKARVVEKGVRHYPREAGHTTVRASHIPKTLWTVGRMWFRLHVPGKADARPSPAKKQPS